MDEIIPSLFYSLPRNILQKVDFIQKDYIGLVIDTDIFKTFFTSTVIAIFMIFISYSLGKKIFNKFRKEPQHNDYLLAIGIGYILIASGITILGALSLLNFLSISLFLLLVIIYSLLFPFSVSKNLKYLFIHVKNDFVYLKKNTFVFIWILLFIVVAIINIINPEIREDQYHVDFPSQYLKYQTIMIPPKEHYHISAIPLLGEMYYLIGILLGSKETARFINLLFYILIILTLSNFSRIKKYKFLIYSPVIFVTAPLIIHESSSVYVDFFWIFCFILSVLILIRNKPLKNTDIIMSGLFFGGMLATKIWTMVFIPIPSLYLIWVNKNINSKQIILYYFFSALVSGIWYIRSLILTGSPIYYAIDPTFKNTSNYFSLLKFFGINYSFFEPLSYINVFSPLFFLGCLLFFYKLKKNISLIYKLNLFKYLLLVFLVYFFITYSFGRYLLGLYMLSIFFASIGIYNVISDFKHSKYILNFFLLIFFSYYLINSAIILPYSFGLANKNKYLTRVLSRDFSSYYDFDKKFDKYISDKDFVATYGIFGYYYANFNYLDTGFIFDKNKNSFEMLKRYEFTKLYIKGGDINWFCNINKLEDCESEKYSLVSHYSAVPNSATQYFLYAIK